MKDLKILIVTSDEDFRSKTGTVISESGFQYEFVTNISEAAQKTSDKHFDIVLLDFTADCDEKIEYLERASGEENFDFIIVVADNDCRQKAEKKIAPGVCTYLQSPLDLDELRLMLENIIKVNDLRIEVRKKEEKLFHLDVINTITRKTLTIHDKEIFLWELAKVIQETLNLFNVNIFILDEEKEMIYLQAFAGGFGDDLMVGYSLKVGEGINGWVAQNRKSYISGDVKNDPLRIQGFAFEESVQSEMAVPIVYNSIVFGTIHAESTEREAFSNNDLMLLETVADQVSLAFENKRLSWELMESKKLSDTINDSLPDSILILDRDFRISHANMTYCEINGYRREELIGKFFHNFLPNELIQHYDVAEELRQVINSGIPIVHNGIRHSSPYHPDKIQNITFIHVQSGRNPKVMVLIQDVTDFTKKTYQLSLLREISLAMQGVLERDKLLHIILTCMTAGFAIGFNRAFIFLVDEERNELRGIMGVGPSSREEAYWIWGELSRQTHTFQDYLKRLENGEFFKSNLQGVVEGIRFNLSETKNVFTETVATGKYVHVLNAWDDPLVDDTIKRMLASGEFVSIPLIAKKQPIGILIADNAYSGRSINEESIEVLTMFAGPAAIAIENAKIMEMLEQKVKELQKANIELKKAQDLLIRNERLAAIGEVSARLAHEIRNPLSTIGGFALSIPKKYDDKEKTLRIANIIVEEVKRLEHTLSNVLDFSKPSFPNKVRIDLNKIIIDTLNIMEGDIVSKGVIAITDFHEENLEAEFDPNQIKQVLINLIGNALSAMPEGGALELKTSRDNSMVRIDISDTGEGISSDYLANIFDPFFTTRLDGTGLGLSISNRIIQNHNGSIEVKSEEGKGTTVSVFLPVIKE